MVTLRNVGKYQVLSQYAISCRSNSLKLQKMAKNVFFGSLDHSKMHFCDLWMILHDLVMLPEVGRHLVISQYAISNRPKTRKWQKTLFWPLGSFKKAFLRILNDLSWPGNLAESWKTFSTITICSIKSIQQTELQKMAKNLIFGSLDHSKMLFSDIWTIL